MGIQFCIEQKILNANTDKSYRICGHCNIHFDIWVYVYNSKRDIDKCLKENREERQISKRKYTY